MPDPYDRLPDPDEVGQSEYRLVHEFVTDLRKDGAEYLLIQSALDELYRSARRVMLEYIRETNIY
jgi:hypothetical protein